jgi:hypothetical protein
MRVFLMLLIFAIGYSGFTAAAHAYGSDCGMTQSKESPADKAGCPDEQQKIDDQADQNKSTGGIDCHHCCSAEIGFSSDFSVNFDIASMLLSPLPDQVPTDSHISSLLRPPRHLV